MIYYFFGKDNFLTKLEADKKVSELRAQGYKKVVLESINDLKEITKSGSLFSEKKCFVFITEKLKETDKKSFKELSFSDDKNTVFVLIEKSIAPSLLFGRTKVEKVKTNEVDEKWLKNQAKEFDIETDRALVSYFLNLDKKDLDAGYFYYELLKLSLYTHSTSSGSTIDYNQSLKPGIKVGLKDYLEISQSKEELNYFEWVKAVLEKQTAKALKHVPENEYEALGRLKSLINIFELILVAEGEVSPGDSQKFLSKNSPFWMKNIRQWANKMSYQQKFESLEKLLDFEVGVKTGRLSSIEALKLFVIGQSKIGFSAYF